METERCKRIVAAIQNLEPTETMELFRLLHKYKCQYTRNNNGIFVNLSWLSDDMLERIEQYVAFCSKSHCEVKKYESICDVLNKNIQYQKNPQPNQDDNEIVGMSINDTSSKYDKKQLNNKISSSMRFYLLKKRFAKQIPIITTAKNDLSREEYVL
jgi:hypothetical protein